LAQNSQFGAAQADRLADEVTEHIGGYLKSF
jgi:hypothetical protein